MRHNTKLLHLQPLRQVEALFSSANSPAPATESDIVETGERSTAPDMPATFVTQLLDLHEYERKRIGQELHDSAGQLLISLQLSVARLKSIQQNCNRDTLIDEIQDTVREIDHEIRALAFLHYPAELGGRTLGEAVQSLVQGFGRRTGIRTNFKCLGDPTAAAEPVSVTLLRVAQEALVNVHRHSHASSAKVILERHVDRLHLTISDDGIGIPSAVDARMEHGIGLQGMRYRVEMQGGRFNVRSLKHGTKISATMPFVA